MIQLSKNVVAQEEPQSRVVKYHEEDAGDAATSEDAAEKWMIRWPFILYFLDAFSHLYRRVCPSVGPSVRLPVCQTRVEFPRNGPNSIKISSGIRKYAI